MGRECSPGRTEECMMESTSMIKSKAMVYLLGQMVGNMKDTG